MGSRNEPTGSNMNPCIKANPLSLYKILCEYIEDRGKLHAKQKESRAWAERYWDPKIHVKRYLEFISARL